MELPLYQLDAFTSRLFGGNPAAVCPLTSWLPDTLMQTIAAENNLAETAFLVPAGELFELRWFTPAVEVDLCGHATLAAAWVVFHRLGFPGPIARFESRSGVLPVERVGDLLRLDFPSRPGRPLGEWSDLAAALGATPEAAFQSRDLMAVFRTEADVRGLRPDMARLAELDALGIIATAPGTDCDFVSRFFAPGAGIPEDPATGSAHCTLVPYWAERLGRLDLHARQVSSRVGELTVHLRGDRVWMDGAVQPYLEGRITVPDS